MTVQLDIAGRVDELVSSYIHAGHLPASARTSTLPLVATAITATILAEVLLDGAFQPPPIEDEDPASDVVGESVAGPFAKTDQGWTFQRNGSKR